MTSHKDYYDVLEINPHADRRAIAEAYERLSRRYQPDEHAPPSDPQRMSDLDEAFDILDDPQRRAEYDRLRANTGAAPAADTEGATAAPPGPPRNWLALVLLGVGSAVALAGLIALVVLLFFTDSERKVTLASGLVYTELETGSGGPPHPGDALTVHYTGTLVDGTEFGSSRDGNPIVFLLGAGEVIPGWDEGFASMTEGGRRRLTIPPGLAYGDAGQSSIPPNATLVFDVELLQIEATGQEITTGSGLKYVDREIGRDSTFQAITPKSGDEVVVQYTGETTDGTRFADTQPDGQPYTFVLGSGSEIDGFDEGVSTMKVGGSRRLIVPPELAYGKQGKELIFQDKPVTLPPGATLIFEVKLIEVK